MVRIGTKLPKFMAISYRASATKMLRLADRQHHVCCLLYLILFCITDIREFTPCLSFTSQGTAGSVILLMH